MSIKLPALRARLTSTTAKVQQGLTRTGPVVAEGDPTGANLRPAKPPRLTTWKHHAVAGYALISRLSA